MIRDLSATLESLLTDPVLTADLPQLATASVVFDRPTDTFAPPSTSIDLFLFDIRENFELRTNERVFDRVGRDVIVRQPPRRIDCSYLLTAWPVGGPDLPLQEHRLLGQALQLLGRQPTVPAGFLQGSLAGQEPPLPLIVPQIEGLKSPAEFWTAMSSRLRAALTVTVTISVPLAADIVGPAVTTLDATYGDNGPFGPVDEPWVAIGGLVTDTGGTPIEGATVDVLDAGLRGITDDQGQYTFPSVPRGHRTVRTVAVGFDPETRSFDVPGRPEDYEFTLTPSP